MAGRIKVSELWLSCWDYRGKTGNCSIKLWSVLFLSCGEKWCNWRNEVASVLGSKSPLYYEKQKDGSYISGFGVVTQRAWFSVFPHGFLLKGNVVSCKSAVVLIWGSVLLAGPLLAWVLSEREINGWVPYLGISSFGSGFDNILWF